MKDMTWPERLSVISSVVSITGVSLVWLSDLAGKATFMTKLFGVVASVSGAAASVGVAVIAFQIFMFLREYVQTRWPSMAFGIQALAFATLIWCGFLVIIFIWFLVKEAWLTRF